jgi:hypothetical protein
MALLTVEIPEKLLSKLKRTGRPAQEVIVEALEETLNDEAVDEKIASLSAASQALDQGENELASMRRRGEHKPEVEDLPREEVVRRLIEAGFVRRPEEYDSPATREWLSLSEEERQQRIKEMEEVYFPDAPASRIIIRNRKRLETDVPRQEVVRRLVATGLIRSPGSWDMEAARQWRQLPEEEQQKLIHEVTALYFPDSPASKFLIEEMEV